MRLVNLYDFAVRVGYTFRDAQTDVFCRGVQSSVIDADVFDLVEPGSKCRTTDDVYDVWRDEDHGFEHVGYWKPLGNRFNRPVAMGTIVRRRK